MTSSPRRSEGGLGLGTLGTSVLFLGTILVIVIYLTITDKDRTESVRQHTLEPGAREDARRS